MKRAMAMAVLLVAMAGGCKGEKKAEDSPAPATADPGASAPSHTAAAAKDEPALPSIGDDPSPAKICARLAAAAAAEGGEGEAKWKELAPECEKNLADRASSSPDKYSAFAECMRDKQTFTAVMNDCRQLEQ